MHKLTLNLGKKKSSIIVGKGSLKEILHYLPKKTSSLVLISDERLQTHRKMVMKVLKSSKLPVSEIVVKAGEDLKNIESIYPLYQNLLESNADRDTIIIALGGGSIGDAAGFIASTYLRGISWIGLPTTLLAQVDSAVGGKTGINHKVGKNLIGSFHQPCLVLCDSDFLNGLGEREIVSGTGEIIKYALTFDKPFFQYLEKNLDRLLKADPKILSEAITKSLKWKCKTVEKDEFDRLGIREVLNFGHTFGHALESATSYQVFQHGEAVLWGMRFALALSMVRGHISHADREKMDALIRRVPLISIPKHLKSQDIFPFMKKDKKASAGTIRFVLLDKIGRSISDKKVQAKDLDLAFELIKGKEK
ncbi:MAG: 3-dehydroquinate synthase [Bacteriovoracaceae bacterium]